LIAGADLTASAVSAAARVTAQVGGTRTLLFASEGAAYETRFYSYVNSLELVVGARWDGTQWELDATPPDGAMRLTLAASGNGFTVAQYGGGPGGVSPFAESAWVDITRTWCDADDNTFDSLRVMRVGRALTGASSDLDIPRIAMSVTAGANVPFLKLDGGSMSAYLYGGPGSIKLVVNAQYDDAAGTWSRDDTGDSYMLELNGARLVLYRYLAADPDGWATWKLWWSSASTAIRAWAIVQVAAGVVTVLDGFNLSAALNGGDLRCTMAEAMLNADYSVTEGLVTSAPPEVQNIHSQTATTFDVTVFDTSATTINLSADGGTRRIMVQVVGQHA